MCLRKCDAVCSWNVASYGVSSACWGWWQNTPLRVGYQLQTTKGQTINRNLPIILMKIVFQTHVFHLFNVCRIYQDGVFFPDEWFLSYESKEIFHEGDSEMIDFPDTLITGRRRRTNTLILWLQECCVPPYLNLHGPASMTCTAELEGECHRVEYPFKLTKRAYNKNDRLHNFYIGRVCIQG